MMRAVGYDDEDFRRPLIGVAHSWIEIMPCNFNHRQLAEWVKEGIREAGGTPVEFNTIAVSDGIAMGTEGMKASLISREVVADSIELVTRGHLLDALVCISGCDKTIPGTVMALARMDIPGLMVYGGSILPGRFQGKDVTIGDVFEAVGKHAVGKLDDKELLELEKVACPGAGACGGQFTANTMATAFEALGISPAGSSRVPATDQRRKEVMKQAGRRTLELLKEGVTPRQIITKPALFWNSPFSFTHFGTTFHACGERSNSAKQAVSTVPQLSKSRHQAFICATVSCSGSPRNDARIRASSDPVFHSFIASP